MVGGGCYERECIGMLRFSEWDCQEPAGSCRTMVVLKNIAVLVNSTWRKLRKCRGNIGIARKE